MTQKWRKVLATTDPADWYGAYIPALLRACAEGKIPDTAAFFYVDRPGVLLQRYCDVLRDVNYEAVVENHVNILRGITAGGGVIYGEPGTEPWLLLVWNKDNHPEIPTQPDLILMKLLGSFADLVSEKYKIPLRYRPLNDIELWDPKLKTWRKVMGTGASGIFTAMGFGCFPQACKLSPLLAKVTVSPAEKFADKVLKETTLRGWNFEEAGVYPKGLKEIDRIREDWIDIYLKAIKRSFNIEVEDGEWTDIEMTYFKESKKQFGSEQWIFAKSAEKKFEEIPPGTSLGKAFLKVTGGPLIRTYVLREDDTIKDMMFTGTMHMVPADALEKLEKELIGKKIDEKAINSKVNEWYSAGVQIGMLEPSQLVGVIMKACKQSYEAG